MEPWIRRPPDSAGAVPLVGHVPHDGTHIPPDVREDLVLDEQGLATEILRVTDHLTDRLFSAIARAGGVMHVNRLSRLVIDPERFRDDADEIMASKGAGAVYRVTSDGRALRPPDFPDASRESLLHRFFDPYSESFASLITTTLERFGRCLILDCHSFPEVPLGWELHPEVDRPPVCIGTDPHHTPPNLTELLVDTFRSEGREVAVDSPFRGTYTPMRYWRRDERVASVMIEIRRDTYIDERTSAPNDRFEATEEIVSRAVEACVSWLEGPEAMGVLR